MVKIIQTREEVLEKTEVPFGEVVDKLFSYY